MVGPAAFWYPQSCLSLHPVCVLPMLILQLITLLLTTIDVQVDLLDGDSVTGSLTSMTTDELTLQKDGQSTTVDLQDVVTVYSQGLTPELPAESPGRIVLMDGSDIVGSLESLTATEVIVQSSLPEQFRIPRPAVRTIQLSATNPDWAAEWREFTQRTNEDDLLILIKRDGSGLDFYGGVISATEADKLNFVLDGDTVPVPLDRIYGLVFATTQSDTNGTIAVRLSDGSGIVARRLRLDGELLEVQTAWKQTLTIPLSLLDSLDFSRGRFHYLSDLDPVKETYMGIHPKGSLLEELLKADDVLGEQALKLWKLHRDRIPMGPYGPLPLTLRGKVYEKGVWLFPRCRIDYALDGQYSAFQTLAGVDDEVAFNCSRPDDPSKVQLTILTDGDEVWQKLIEAPADPVSIDLDVSGVRTLSILVDFGDDDSACDFLDLADARLLVAPEQ